MHLLIHQKRPEIKFCLHVHVPNILKIQIFDRFPVTSKFLSYGTIDLAKEASNILQSSDYAVLRDHGIVVIGENLNTIVGEVIKIIRM